MRDHLTTEALLSSNRALLGAITTNLRGVTIDFNNQLFVLRAYFDNGATDDDKALIDAALTEIIADLHNEIKEFQFEPIDLSFPNKMVGLKHWVYLRHEDDDM
ncbi:MAG: hypothetical protein ABUT20_33675 [Bacteroidota bacterium]